MTRSKILIQNLTFDFLFRFSLNDHYYTVVLVARRNKKRCGGKVFLVWVWGMCLPSDQWSFIVNCPFHVNLILLGYNGNWFCTTTRFVQVYLGCKKVYKKLLNCHYDHHNHLKTHYHCYRFQSKFSLFSWFKSLHSKQQQYWKFLKLQPVNTR